jgi:hypothetical protein
VPLPGGAGLPSEAGDYPLVPGDDGYDALADLWSRLSRPFNVISTVSVLTGLSRPAVGELVGSVIATSPEAERLLDVFPRTIRSLATSMGTQAERCIGALRGPVLWSETLAARASSFGDPDLYICATPSRAYDIDENRVLVAALLAVRDAAQDAVEHAGGRQRYQDRAVQAAIRNGNDAARFAEHPSLARVSRQKPSPRALKRTRSGKKKTSYEPAVQMLERAADPLSLDQVRDVCDRRTRAQHLLLMRLVHRLEVLGGRLPAFRAEQSSLYAGPVQYHHPRRANERGGLAGIVVGQLLIDVPDRLGDQDRASAAAALAARAGGRASLVVVDDDDVELAVGRAVELAVSS